MVHRILYCLGLVCLGLVGAGQPTGVTAAYSALPDGFTRVVHTLGLNKPTSFAFEGERIFVAQKEGMVRIVKKNGKLRAKPYVTLGVSTEQERGVLGIAVDPKFAKNRFVYVFYTTGPGAKNYTGTPQNRVSRFKTKKGTGKREKILLDNIPSDTGFHNGGALQFGFDGKLYVTVGDSALYWDDVPKLDNLRGKILRINRTGTVPEDNPFYNTPNALESIYTYGFRNPFRLVPRPANSSFIVGDLGRTTWEELDSLEAGQDYGWARFEGPCTFETPDCDPEETDFGTTTPPIHYYKHTGEGEIGGAIIAGAFPQGSNYPEPYASALFYGDWLHGWVHVLSLDDANKVTNWEDFDSLVAPTAFATGPDGNIYVVDYVSGVMFKYVYEGGERLKLKAKSLKLKVGREN